MVLLSLPDSAFVSGAVSDSAGVFTLQATADNIRSVEVVHNPGARYEASVKAVIRIVTKRPAGEGFGFGNRLVTENYRTYGQTTYDQFDFNYRKKGFDLSGILYGGHYRTGTNQHIIMDTRLDKHWTQDIDATHAKIKTDNWNGSLSMNYQLNENHSMGARYHIDRDMTADGDWRFITRVTADGAPYEESNSQMLIRAPYTQHDLNLYYDEQAG